MLNEYRFTFKYTSQRVNANGDGVVKAEDIPDAKIVAENGVAQDFKGSTADVTITSISQIKAKKKRHAK